MHKPPVLEKFINQNQETIKIAKKIKQSCTIFNLNIIYVNIQVNRHTAPYLVHFLPCLAPQLVRSKMPIQKPPVLAQMHISSSKINIYLTNSIGIRKICTTNITHASMSAHIGVRTILDVLSAISHPDLIIFCIKQFKIEPKFAQLQAIKNMQHQNKQAQFKNNNILEHSCNSFVVRTVFLAKSLGHRAI